MASTKTVTVVIDGKEYVSKAAGEASGGMEGFASKIPGWGKAIALATAAFAILSKAVQAVGEFVMESIDEYDKYASSQNKMAAQSKLTGVSLADLKAMAKTAREEFNLGSVVANDAATTVAKYASRAGDATQANKLMAAALDLGAASGLTAAESMDALEQGLRGQDEGFDKLLGKNPSTLWKEYADANGLAVGKMTDTQKRMAELTAVVNAGNIVQGSYNERIASGAGQTEAMSNQMGNAKVAFGAAIQPIRIFVVQGLVALIQMATPVVVAIARIANFVGVVFVGSFQLARSAVGALIEGVGKLTGNKSMEDWGAKQAAAFPEFVKQLDAMEKKLNDSGTAATEHGKAHTLATVKITASAKDNTKAVSESADEINAKLDAKLGTPMKQLIGLTEGAIRDLGKAAREQLPPETAAKFNAHMEDLAANAEKVRDRITTIGKGTKTVSEDTRDIAREVGTFARGAIDAADAFGVIDESAKASLNSAVNIASALGDMAKSGFSFAGAVGVIGGVASLVSAMMAGDKARKQLLNQNNVELARLRDEIGNISLNVTGDDFGKAVNLLTDLVPKLKDGNNPAAFGANAAALSSALAKSGMSLTKLEEIAKALGISFRDKNGNFIFSAFKQLLEGLGLVELGQFGKDYASQKESVTAGFGVNQTSGVGQIGALGQLGGSFSSALAGVVDVNDLSGTRTRLQSLFGRLQSGGLSAGELGGLTGTQFQDFITDIIGRIDNLTPPTGAVASTGTGGAVTGGGTTMPGDTVTGTGTAVMSVTDVLVSHTALHARVADATEESAKRLASIDEKMDALIAVSADRVTSVNERLAIETTLEKYRQGA